MITSQTIDEIIMAFSCVQYEKIIYISTPITGGALLLEYESEEREQILRLNLDRAAVFTSRVSQTTGCPVINPARFIAQNWSQEKYIMLWKKVIRTIPSEVWFNTGWEYSNGCVQEFLEALQAGIPVKSADGNPLSRQEALRLLRCAIRDLSAKSINTSMLEYVASCLDYSAPNKK